MLRRIVIQFCYLLSLGLQFSNRFPWTQESIGIPIYRYNYQDCQYYGGTATNFPTNQYPEIWGLGQTFSIPEPGL